MKSECVIYCRVSSENQTAGNGLTRQMNVCLEYARERSLVVVAVFSEVASGAEPLIVRGMAERMAAKRKCAIVCEAYDRWSRHGADDAPPVNVLMASKANQVLEKDLERVMFPGRAA